MPARIAERGKVFRDPVHRLIRVEPNDDFVLDIIDTPVFQRLRRVRQLGVSWLTFHGAEHSRFSHSLGVFNFAQRILHSLRERYKSNEALREYLDSHAKELKAAALLHDVGHAPFSHLLERAFQHSPDHEDTTVKLITERESGIPQILESADIDPANVAEIIEKTSNDRIIVDIVSSQLDADRMDYLLRDSLYTGVEYGTYDSEWVIHNLCLGKAPLPGSGSSGENEFAHHRLCLDRDRGLHSAEQLILARLHMTIQVYMHRVTRGYEVLVLNLLQLAAQRAQNHQLPDDTPRIVRLFFEAHVLDARSAILDGQSFRIDGARLDPADQLQHARAVVVLIFLLGNLVHDATSAFCVSLLLALCSGSNRYRSATSRATADSPAKLMNRRTMRSQYCGLISIPKQRRRMRWAAMNCVPEPANGS